MTQAVLCGSRAFPPCLPALVTPETEDLCSNRACEQDHSSSCMHFTQLISVCLIKRFYPRGKRNKGYGRPWWCSG